MPGTLCFEAVCIGGILPPAMLHLNLIRFGGYTGFAYMSDRMPFL